VHLTAREREQKALALRKAGVDFLTIAREVGYRHAGSAYNAVKRALERSAKESAVDREHLRKLELARLDDMTLALAPQVKRGHHGAIDRWLKIMDRRARLAGLAVPARVELKVEDIDAAIERELERLAARRQAADAGEAAGEGGGGATP